MKNMFTLFMGLFLSIALFASDRRPAVMLNNNSRQYKVVIDGRSYFGDNIRIDLNDRYGYGYSRNHSIKVYEMGRGYFQRERLVDATNFFLGKRDMIIHIDRFGQIRIQEFRDRGRDRWDRNEERRDRDDRDHRF